MVAGSFQTVVPFPRLGGAFDHAVKSFDRPPDSFYGTAEPSVFIKEWIVPTREWFVPSLESLTHSQEWFAPALEWLSYSREWTVPGGEWTRDSRE